MLPTSCLPFLCSVSPSATLASLKLISNEAIDTSEGYFPILRCAAVNFIFGIPSFINVEKFLCTVSGKIDFILSKDDAPMSYLLAYFKVVLSSKARFACPSQ